MRTRPIYLKVISAAVFSVLIQIACQARPVGHVDPPTAISTAQATTSADPVAKLPPGAPSATRIAANLLLGNPSNATANVANKNNLLVVHPYYTLSYNNGNGEPNWVSWEVTKEDLGTAPRRRTFAADTTLPEGLNRIEHHDYTNSGFDRGHMCPHSDRAANITMSYATFTMTNIVPQSPNLNRKAWNSLEIYLRDFAQKDNDHVYVICGPAGFGGWGSHGFETTLAGGKVKVPAMCWKIAVIVPPGEGSDISRIGPTTRVIAAIMPNDQSLDYTWGQFRTSVSQIEKVTGLKFFTKLPPAVAEALDKKIDDAVLPPPVIPHYADEDEAPSTTPAKRE